jgi:hypothetical protein
MAEPGRAGRFRAARVAFFLATIVSLSVGFPPIVLLDKPSPGLAGVPFFGELGLLGSFLKSRCAVPSKPSMMLSLC